MSKSALSIILLAGIALSACGGQVQPTATPTLVPATTEPPPTETPTATDVPDTEEPTPTITPTEFVPDNANDCINKASFVSDLTIPDNSNVIAGTPFIKTWRIRNTGTCIWWSGYTLAHYSELTMSAPASVPLKVTNPGDTIDISVDLIAPSTTGIQRGNFVVKNPSGLIMQIDQDSRLWIIINVVSEGGGSTVTPSTGAGTAVNTPTGGGTPATPGTPQSGGPGYASVNCQFTLDVAKVTETINSINAYRAQNGNPAFTVKTQLNQAAQAHANDMACNQLFYHNGSNGSTPQSRVAASGYAAASVTENVYGSYPPLTGQGVVSWWANDKTDIRHNENLLTTEYTEIGVGYSFFNNFGYYVVVFARP